ncbi:bifunctional phosphopantothenoylcysteine decarboxylase/phosphopantothenate--cysteine ligase CoaBC [Porphyromonas circumdentaria]|uniref:Coenzyme A biosynthesis bifunctional protein CoaBC n=1 Tax=Porphyromonas circumdentaria TaxID=29524 RepID=A0A1T4MS77_9PORP|nr:bifunctional phosphopantothenoylcysteine decarboxylase/phosphopantothenate--cysteine ligase CoaBC [Porphyromonas circumdentaria]MBB6275924.1 phosphopantothenoylcysteine decarboxylase/phosphopantothenate--cysteine ligase [Porphyromonas circumdentaria]MDO4723017.1 bifunctional phosphopantothenoylcysteine decarboxylase/phosphopantothenate--cysteine ligase CoaBC [Porphyromonas circumdentaria]SJZ69558.1 Phosphopantothenate-cysteine ligase [Porphyromonas circumdentaria]
MKLQGKHIVVGITGSIAAYKAATLIRCLIKEGAEVQVVMTPAGKEFITPLTLSTLTNKPVVSEFFDRRDGSWYSHVSLGIWADLLLIAPASAATLGKMAHGIADNMLLTTYLSMKAPTWVAPAMDLDMYAHEATQNNLSVLRERGVHIIDAGSGFLASGLEGKGRMAEPEEITAEVIRYFKEGATNVKGRHDDAPLHGKQILITAGPTYESIDAVRFVGNHSSGRMGYALAEVCARKGAAVTLVSGPTSLPDPVGVKTVRVVSALDMLAASEAVFAQSDIAIFSAAVADYRPATPVEGKMKREALGEELVLRFTKNPDIAATLGHKKRSQQLLVGFALETTCNEEEALRKMKVKNMDLMILNSLSDQGAGFGGATNKIALLSATSTKHFPLKTKEEVATDIVEAIIEKIERI